MISGLISASAEMLFRGIMVSVLNSERNALICRNGCFKPKYEYLSGMDSMPRKALVAARTSGDSGRKRRE